FGHQNVGAFRKVNDRVGPASVTREQERTAKCVEAVGERFLLAVGRRAGLEPEVSVLDRSHLNVGILIDDATAMSWPLKVSAIGSVTALECLRISSALVM